jgi:hypothetical protein
MLTMMSSSEERAGGTIEFNKITQTPRGGQYTSQAAPLVARLVLGYSNGADRCLGTTN